jgi:hypothetical protein
MFLRQVTRWYIGVKGRVDTHLSEGHFIPFEFSLAEPQIKPSGGFLSELSDILYEHGLDQDIGITKALPPEHL